MYEKLLQTTDISGVYYVPPTGRSSFEKAASKLGLSVMAADLSSCRNTADALHQLGGALHFPSWYGANFDALFDCLLDPDGKPGKAQVLWLNGTDALRWSEPEDFLTLIEVLQAAAEARRTTSSPCWIMLDIPAPGIASLPKA